MIQIPWTYKPPYGVKLNRQHPLAQGLVGCWLMNEGGGNTVFDLASGNNGTAPALIWDGDFLRHEGVGIVFNTPVSFPGDFSFVCTFNVATVSYYGNLLDGSVSNDSIILNDTAEVRIYQNGVHDDFDGWPFGLNECNNLILTRDGSDWRGWKNGKEDSSTTPVTTGDLTFSHMLPGEFACSLKFIYLYDRALSPQEALSISSNPWQIVEPLFIPSATAQNGLLPIKLTGSVDATAGCDGEISKTIGSSGTVDALTESSGGISIIKALSGAADCLADAAGILSVKKALTGSVDGIADAQGQITLEGIIRLTGSVDAVADADGQISITRQLSGLVDAIADAQGQVTFLEENKIYLTGTVDAVAESTGQIGVTRGLTGTIEALTDASGELSAKLNLAGSVDAIANAIGSLQFIGDGTLGVVVDPTMDSITLKRLLKSITKKRSLKPIITERTIEPI